MGCTSSKTTAIQELNSMIARISKENEELLKEKEKLMRNSQDPFEEKNSLIDLQTMNSELFEETQKIKQMVIEILPSYNLNEEKAHLPQNVLENITKVQVELEEKSKKIKEIQEKRERLQKENTTLEELIENAEKKLRDLDADVEDERSVIISEGNETFSNNNLADEGKPGDGDEISTSSDKFSYENLLLLSENEINKELKSVEKEIEGLANQIKDIEIKEGELNKLEGYIEELQNKMDFHTKNANVKDEIKKSQNKIEYLRQEKLKIKEEVARLNKIKNNN